GAGSARAGTSGRRQPGRTARAGLHLGGRPVSAPGIRERSNAPIILPDGRATLAGCRDPYHAKPFAAPAWTRPQAGGQAAKHQTHPQQPKKHHKEPKVYLVWCNDPPVGVGYRSASGYTPTCPVREAADLVL